LMKNVLDISNELSQTLQKKDQNILNVMNWLISQRSGYKL
jgi:hypothetical protein